jgi:hypothetical protein
MLVCLLVASLATAPDPAAAETLPRFDGSLDFPTIRDASAPEEYPFEVELLPGEALVQLSESAAQVVYGEKIVMETIDASPARDSSGVRVPTTLKVTAPNIVTEIVHHQASDPASGGVSFAYPINAGEPFTTGTSTVTVVTPAPTPTPTPAPRCRVPLVVGLGRRAAATKLRAAHCTLGKVRRAHGATPSKGKVVKQFHAAGTELEPGAPVAIKLG